jgi:hypothetical protein
MTLSSGTRQNVAVQIAAVDNRQTGRISTAILRHKDNHQQKYNTRHEKFFHFIPQSMNSVT